MTNLHERNTSEDLANREALTLAAVTEVAGEDAAEFIKVFRRFHPTMFLPEKREKFPILDKIDSLSAPERTKYFVNLLRALKVLRATTSARPPENMPDRWTPDYLAFVDSTPEIQFLSMDLTKYPIYLNEGSSGNFNVTDISYAAAEVTKGKMVVEEELATEFLRMSGSRRATSMCFAKGLAKHMVAPYRKAPSKEYLYEFHNTLGFLNDNWKGFGRQNAWADFRHYLRKMMNNAARASSHQ